MATRRRWHDRHHLGGVEDGASRTVESCGIELGTEKLKMQRNAWRERNRSWGETGALTKPGWDGFSWPGSRFRGIHATPTSTLEVLMLDAMQMRRIWAAMEGRKEVVTVRGEENQVHSVEEVWAMVSRYLVRTSIGKEAWRRRHMIGRQPR